MLGIKNQAGLKATIPLDKEPPTGVMMKIFGEGCYNRFANTMAWEQSAQ